nr:hypothetical protein Iba_chr02aCG14880 [Ipomoea batatas]
MLQKSRQHKGWMVPLDFAMDSNSCRHLMFFKRIKESPIQGCSFGTGFFLLQFAKLLCQEKLFQAQDSVSVQPFVFSGFADNILQETRKKLLLEKTRFGWEAIACEAAKVDSGQRDI